MNQMDADLPDAISTSRRQIYGGTVGFRIVTSREGESYLNDLPVQDIHRLNSGHFALEDSLTYIAERMKASYCRT